MTCVKVTRYPWGETSFSEAVCDVFERDTLTVSCADPDYDRKYGPMQVFKAGTWLEAIVFDDRGNPIYGHLSDFGKQQAALRRAS